MSGSRRTRGTPQGWLACLSIASCHPTQSAWAQTAVMAADAEPHDTVATASPPAALDAGPHGSTSEPPDGGVFSNVFATAPILDPARVTRAAKDYGAARRRVCQSRKQLEQQGVDDIDDPMTVCDPAQPTPLASGSFFKPDADEVLLEVSSGRDAAAGERTLALMRLKGPHYRLVRHLLSGSKFEARVRVRVPGGSDLLMLCSLGGNMGLYPRECGFLGQGHFRADANQADGAFGTTHEIHLVTVTECGPQSWVELGDVTLRNDRIEVGLVVVKAELGPPLPAGEQGYCSEEKNRHEQRFTIPFAVDASGGDRHGTGRVRRLTPIPREVVKVLELY